MAPRSGPCTGTILLRGPLARYPSAQPRFAPGYLSAHGTTLFEQSANGSILFDQSANDEGGDARMRLGATSLRRHLPEWQRLPITLTGGNHPFT